MGIRGEKITYGYRGGEAWQHAGRLIASIVIDPAAKSSGKFKYTYIYIYGIRHGSLF